MNDMFLKGHNEPKGLLSKETFSIINDVIIRNTPSLKVVLHGDAFWTTNNFYKYCFFPHDTSRNFETTICSDIMLFHKRPG